MKKIDKVDGNRLRSKRLKECVKRKEGLKETREVGGV